MLLQYLIILMIKIIFNVYVVTFSITIRLFIYLFKVYQKMLARRLINQQSTSIDTEEFMVTKLKVFLREELQKRFYLFF